MDVMEANVTEVLAEYGEHVHHGRTERLLAGPWNHEVLAGYKKAVRLLGAWVDCDGGAQTDIEKRLEAARKVWFQVLRRLPSLKSFSVRLKAHLVSASVLASLLYGSEVRSFTRVQLNQYQRFVNKMIKRLTYRTERGGTMNMKGVRTMPDLRKECGWRPIEDMIVERQLGYLGHVARYPDTGRESVALGL